MTHLERLTLYLRIHNGSPFLDNSSPFLDDTHPFIDGTHLHNEILIYMPQIRTFTFYINTQNMIFDEAHRKSTDDIQQTLTNIQYGETACIIDHLSSSKFIGHIYSVPFTFTRLKYITNNFPNMYLIL